MKANGIIQFSSPAIISPSQGSEKHHDTPADVVKSPLSLGADAKTDAEEEDNCSICLQPTIDRTFLPTCSHEFCFECILLWSEQSRRCPLCTQTIGEYLIHNIRSRYDFRKHYLAPLRTSPHVQTANVGTSNAALQRARQRARGSRRNREWGQRATEEREEQDKLERSIAKRRWIYQHDLYAKHVASNSFTKYRPHPTPAQFSASPDLISRTITFLRRELQVWEGLDIEFLTTMIISLMKSIDVRSEAAVKLLAEFLDLDAPYVPGDRHVNAEHFAHEVYSYVRSPYKNLFVYDTIVQYESPPNINLPVEPVRGNRWQEGRSFQRRLSRSKSPLRTQSESKDSQKRPRVRTLSTSYSPSGRKYRNTRPLPATVIQECSGDQTTSDSPTLRKNSRELPSEMYIKSRDKYWDDAVHSDDRIDSRGLSGASMSDPLEIQKMDIKGKGKQKADIDPMLKVNQIRLEFGDILMEGNMSSPLEYVDLPSQSGQATLTAKRPCRHLNLRDSIQAHLSRNCNVRKSTPSSQQSNNPLVVTPAGHRLDENNLGNVKQEETEPRLDGVSVVFADVSQTSVLGTSLSVFKQKETESCSGRVRVSPTGLVLTQGSPCSELCPS